MCGMILKAKESLVQDLKNLLKQKDDSYIKLLKRQSDDIDTLLRAMAKEHKDLEATCREVRTRPRAFSCAPNAAHSSVCTEHVAHIHFLIHSSFFRRTAI